MGSMKLKFQRFTLCFAFGFLVLLLLLILGVNSSEDRDLLDSVVRDYAFRRFRRGRVRSGVLYQNISLPSNYSGVEVSVVRMRSSSLWLRGVNFSFFDVPSRTLPSPFSRRILIVYQNLGNLSSVYYTVPNHTLVAPVIGLLAYNAHFNSNGTGGNNQTGSIEFKPTTDPILIRFPEVSSSNNSVAKKCVRFDTNNGEVVQFSNSTETDSCIATGGGHFSLVVPIIQPPPSNPNRKHHRSWEWRKIGFGVGILALGLIFFMCVGILLHKLIRKMRIKRMQKESEKNENLDSIWVGRSRMPSATSSRTQPVLENDYTP